MHPGSRILEGHLKLTLAYVNERGKSLALVFDLCIKNDYSNLYEDPRTKLICPKTKNILSSTCSKKHLVQRKFF